MKSNRNEGQDESMRDENVMIEEEKCTGDEKKNTEGDGKHFEH